MGTYQRPGTYVQETLLPQQVTLAGLADAVGAFVGAINRGPTEPTLITSWSSFVRQYGSFSSGSALAYTVYQAFINGAGACYVKRVLGSDAATATTTLVDRGDENNTLVVSALNEGAWANASTTSTGLSVKVLDGVIAETFDLLVFQGGDSDADIVERFSNCVMDPNARTFVERVVNSQSTLIRVSAVAENPSGTGTDAFPVAGYTAPLSGGADGSTPTENQYTDAISDLDGAPEALVLNIPDAVNLASQTQVNVVNSAIAYAQDRGDVFVVVDAPDSSRLDALDFASTLTATSYAAVYYPHLVVPDPLSTTGAVKTVAPGGAIVGKFLYNDVVNGVAKSPAGVVSPLRQVIGLSQRLTNADLDALNSSSSPVNALRPVPGAGFCVMGARTLRPGQADQYINVRRTLIYLQKKMKDLTQFAVFRNNDARLWAEIRTVLGVFLNEFWQGGGLKGVSARSAFFVVCDGTNNNAASIASGQINVAVGVALQQPAEFIVIRLSQYEGGASVTEQ